MRQSSLLYMSKARARPIDCLAASEYLRALPSASPVYFRKDLRSAQTIVSLAERSDHVSADLWRQWLDLEAGVEETCLFEASLCTAVRLITLCWIVMIISLSLSGAVEDAKLRLVLVNFLRREKRCWNVVLGDRVKVPIYLLSHNFCL